MRALLNVTHQLGIQVSRTARYLADTLQGDRISAEAVTTVVRTYGDSDASNAKPLEHAFDQAQLRTNHEAALRELRDRGDSQLVDEPNRGFRIEHLENGRSHEPVPVDTVFPNSVECKANEFPDSILMAAHLLK